METKPVSWFLARILVFTFFAAEAWAQACPPDGQWSGALPNGLEVRVKVIDCNVTYEWGDRLASEKSIKPGSMTRAAVRESDHWLVDTIDYPVTWRLRFPSGVGSLDFEWRNTGSGLSLRSTLQPY